MAKSKKIKIHKKINGQLLQMNKSQLQKRLDNEKVIKFKSYISFYKSIVDQDRAAVVICNLKHEIIYMNPVAVHSYEKWGGDKLIGKSLLECHNQERRYSRWLIGLG